MVRIIRLQDIEKQVFRLDKPHISCLEEPLWQRPACIPAFQELPPFDDYLALINILARDTDEVTQLICERGAFSGVKVVLEQIYL
jgi:hypothetical protein